MKRLLLLLMASGIAVSHAQTVREENRGMIGKITATWCGPCGSWGWTMSDEFISKYEDDAFYVGIFSSTNGSCQNSKFLNTTAQAWASMFGMSGYPSFSINGVDKSLKNTAGGGVNTAGIKKDIDSVVTAYMASTVVAGTGFWYEKDGDEVTVQIKTKFFEDVTGDYYVAAYVVEDGALNAQNGQTTCSGSTEHHNVLRAAMGSSTWGTQLGSGSITAGEEFETSYTLTADSDWDMAKLKVITIIWKKNNMGKYEYVNGNDKEDFPATVADIEKGMTNLAVYPNPASGNTTLSVMMQQAADVQIRVMDLTGRVVYTDKARFNTGVNAWNIETAGFAGGTYLVSVSSDRGTVTQRLAVVK